MMMRLIALSLAVLTLTSCAVHYGNTASNAAVMNDNFRIMDLATGQAETTHIFGIGGLKKDALVLDAKREMYQNHPLEAGQIYANITVDFKRSFYFIVETTLATVSADIVQFNPSEEQKARDLFSKEAFSTKKVVNTGTVSEDYLLPGRSVGIYSFGGMKTMELEDQFGKKRYQLLAEDSSQFIFDRKDIYLIDDTEYPFEHGLNVGEKVQWEKRRETKTGIIVGVNEEMLVVESDDQFIQISPLDVTPIELNNR